MMFGRKDPYERLLQSDYWRTLTADERRDLLKFQEEALAAAERSKLRAREQKERHRYQSRELLVRSIETYFRTGITVVLVGVLGVAIFVGITMHIGAYPREGGMSRSW